MPKTPEAKQILSKLFYSALKVVDGCNAVEQQLIRMPIKGDVAILAVGKAAAAMALGAKKQLNNQIQSALIITKSGSADKTLPWACIESGHPIPNEKSLEAGAKLLEFISQIPNETKFLALISGGASALVEVLPENTGLENLQKINNWLLGSGLAIDDINRVRQAVSLIKAGKALEYLSVDNMTQFLISDVKGNEINFIGSGLFVENEETNLFPEVPDWLQQYLIPTELKTNVVVESHIIASNEDACQAIMKYAEQLKYAVTYHGQTLYGDVLEKAKLLANELAHAKTGIHIWGGETTVVLPENPGRGGRNQHLALALACAIENVKGLTILVGATDGSDGPTEDAGAIIDGFTVQRGQNECLRPPKEYLLAADAGTFLAAAGDLLSTGPTGTNVMDIVIALKEPI